MTRDLHTDAAADELNYQAPPPGWLTVEEVAERVFLDLLSQATAGALVDELDDRDERPGAAGAALLALIFQIQEQVDDAALELINFVLTEIPSVNSLFERPNDIAQISGRLALRRVIDDQGRSRLVAPASWLRPLGVSAQERMAAIGEEAIDDDR